MASLSPILSVFSKLTCAGSSLISNGLAQQVRNKWTAKRNLRDMNRRKLQKEWAPERLRLICLKRADCLPKEIINDAHQTFKERIPNLTFKLGVTRRCVITGRGYGTVYRWRISRFVFRDLADHNLLAGVQRAMW